MAIIPKTVVYTAIIDNYDKSLPTVLSKDNSVDYICFTDTDLQSDGIWQIRKIKRQFADPQRDARRIKLLPHHLVPEYDLSLWVDDNILIKEEYSIQTMLTHLGSSAIASLRHERDCIYDEAKVALSLDVDDMGIISAQMENYRQLGFPEHFGLHATYFLLRKHSDSRCRIFCELWWRELCKQSKQDQLSFDFIRWVTRENIVDLPMAWGENEIFRWGDSGSGKQSGDQHKYRQYWAVPGAPFHEQTPPEMEERQRVSAVMSKLPTNLAGFVEKLDKCDFRIHLSRQGIILKNPNIIIHGKATNTIWTTAGVFCDHSYAFAANDDFVVFDIGMNIGTAALYYAGCEQVKAIYGFEPFLPTYKQARVNFEVNKELSSKITPYNFGLGAENKTLSIHYNHALPGAMSTVFDNFQDAPDVEAAAIRNAAEVLGPLFSAHDEKILLKIDCEGAETEILSALSEGNLLQKVHAIVLEWHFYPPADLTKLLVSNDFFLFVNHIVPDKLGMIYAVNNKPVK